MFVLIDNYDSFTYNLVHYMLELGAEVEVLRNDKFSSEEILSKSNLQGIILSPGPCTPNEAGICLDLIKKSAGKVALLGVCLGHQSIGQAFGANIIRASKPVHGKTSLISHTGKGIFANIKSPFKVTRYHSLIIERETIPDSLEVTATTDEGLIMAIQHKQYNIFGVQFHPESIESEYGHDLLRNFIKLSE